MCSASSELGQLLGHGRGRGSGVRGDGGFAHSAGAGAGARLARGGGRAYSARAGAGGTLARGATARGLQCFSDLANQKRLVGAAGLLSNVLGKLGLASACWLVSTTTYRRDVASTSRRMRPAIGRIPTPPPHIGPSPRRGGLQWRRVRYAWNARFSPPDAHERDHGCWLADGVPDGAVSW